MDFFALAQQLLRQAPHWLTVTANLTFGVLVLSVLGTGVLSAVVGCAIRRQQSARMAGVAVWLAGYALWAVPIAVDEVFTKGLLTFVVLPGAALGALAVLCINYVTRTTICATRRGVPGAGVGVSGG